MAGLRNRIRRLEQRARGEHVTFVLEDGSTVRARSEDLLGCVLAAIYGEEHPLHEPLRHLAPAAEPEALELANLVEALGGKDEEDP